MHKTVFTVGLNDKEEERQLISTETAKDIISEILIGDFKIFAFTMWECLGVYRMTSTGNIVKENSLRIEIATDKKLKATKKIIKSLKENLNQETIMVNKTVEKINFI